MVRVKVSLELGRVAEILRLIGPWSVLEDTKAGDGLRRYLDEVLLGPFVVHASVRCVPREIADQIVRFTGW